MRALFLHFKKNWISYGFDTIVVTVGILGAFALNNWNNNRIANKLEYSVLLQLESDFAKNMESINSTIESYNRDLDQLKYTLKYLGPEADIPSTKAIRKMNRIQYTRLDQVFNTENISLTSEYFNVIKSIEIKNSISTFSSKSTRYYTHEQEVIDQAKSQREMFMKYNSFSFGVDWLKDLAQSIHPSNHLDWLRDPIHQNLVVSRILVINYCLKELKIIKNENQRILDLVTMELKRFE